MSKPFPALCRDCKHSKPKEGRPWILHCLHPIVISGDNRALASAQPQSGTSCYRERERRWFAPCGMRGKLWEQTRLAHDDQRRDVLAHYGVTEAA